MSYDHMELCTIKMRMNPLMVEKERMLVHGVPRLMITLSVTNELYRVGGTAMLRGLCTHRRHISVWLTSLCAVVW